MTRAIWSAPPPVPAGTMNSTGRVGCHAAAAGRAVRAVPRAPAATRVCVRKGCLITGDFLLKGPDPQERQTPARASFFIASRAATRASILYGTRGATEHGTPFAQLWWGCRTESRRRSWALHRGWKDRRFPTRRGSHASAPHG